MAAACAIVSSGGTEISAVIESGGLEAVLKGGTAIDDVVSSGGLAAVGGIALGRS